ncbi:MAG: DNA-protecting protein DprA, partial [Acetobacteraceae bacterium]|nr:DNA-protecting protein DprA [Acetobacteraceae bacterium]
AQVGLGRIPLFARGPSAGLGEPEPSWEEPPEGPEEIEQVRLQMLELISPSPTAVDDLVRRCQFSPSAVIAALLELELAGRVEMLPGNRVAFVSDPSA